MHIIMGLGENVFNKLKQVVIELNNSESNTESEYQVNLQSELQESYDELENNKSMTNNNMKHELKFL